MKYLILLLFTLLLSCTKEKLHQFEEGDYTFNSCDFETTFTGITLYNNKFNFSYNSYYITGEYKIKENSTLYIKSKFYEGEWAKIWFVDNNLFVDLLDREGNDVIIFTKLE